MELGARIGKALAPGSVVSLQGPLGAGKTTFVRGMARALGIEEPVTSPSFTLVSEYDGSMPLCHVDLYRIDNIEEFELLGVDEMTAGTGVTVVEWGERVRDALPEERIVVRISILENGARRVEIEGMPA
jgi:tRNA threonylcarbamoyladenosine biosynthesis protein TsaE